MERVLMVNGMMCNHCKAKVEKALNSVSGVSDARVDLDKKCVYLELSAETNEESLIQAVITAGFEPAGFAL